MSVTIVQAKVKYPAGKVFPSKHAGAPDRINVVATLPSGEEIKIYGDVGSELSRYGRGQAVQLIYDGRNYKPVASDVPALPPAPVPTEPTYDTTPDNAEEAWDAKLAQSASRYRKAIAAAMAIAVEDMEMSAEHLAHPVCKQVVQAIAATLFIASK